MTRWTTEQWERLGSHRPADLRKAQESTQSALNRPLARSVPKAVSKYRNKRCGAYASIKEAKRAAELKLLLAAGTIRNLREQVRYELVPKQEGERAVTWTADFVYEDAGGKTCAEDAKGVRTQQYVIRRKLMLWVHGIVVREV